MVPPSLRRRRLVRALTELRREAGLSQIDAAKLLGPGWDGSKISRIEGLLKPISGDDTFELATALGANEKTVAALVKLARQSRQRGWWQVGYDDVLGQFSDFVELEEDARNLRQFTADVIPGQLQTQAYIEAVVPTGFPNSADEAAKRVQLRLDRQKRMSDHGFALWAIIDEAALVRPVGGPEVMAAQLDHLAALARLSGITVQILPTRVHAHPAMGVPFTLIELADDSRFVYVETLAGGAYVEGQETRAYSLVWEQLQALAVDFATSITIIIEAAATHRRAAHEQ